MTNMNAKANNHRARYNILNPHQTSIITAIHRARVRQQDFIHIRGKSRSQTREMFYHRLPSLRDTIEGGFNHNRNKEIP